MCKPKAEGGKRCAAHMYGSQAAFKEAEVYTGADKEVLSTVFKNLRKEGENLPDPTAQEVEDFADGQRVRARFDETLGERERNTLIRRWTRAREERPDGGLFHAWKHMTSEARRVMKRRIAATFLASSAFVMAACGGKLSEPVDPTPQPTSSETSSSQVLQGEHFSEGLVAGGTDKDSHGEYLEVTLSEDSPLLAYNPDVVSEEAKANFSEEEITAAQKEVSTFVVEEAIDSPLAFDYSQDNASAWLSENEGIFHSEYRDSMKNQLLNPQDRAIIIDTNSGSWSRGVPISGADETRFDGLEVKLDKVDYLENGLVFSYTANYNREVSNPDDPASDVTYVETNDATFTYSIHPDPASGQWLISGFRNNIDTSTTVSGQ